MQIKFYNIQQKLLQLSNYWECDINNNIKYRRNNKEGKMCKKKTLTNACNWREEEKPEFG